MKSVNTYLNFDGTTRDAMTFYAECLGAELEVQTFKDSPMPGPPGSDDRVIHARVVSNGKPLLMASDTMPGVSAPFVQGNNFWINIDCDGMDEIKKLFGAFSQGGKVLMELQDTFWGAHFGMLTDKYGIGWMFNCELPKKA